MGSGPAGLTAALALADHCRSVTLFEQFAAAQPVGSGIILQPTGLSVLNELGLLGKIRALGKRIDRIVGIAMPADQKVLDVNYEVLGGGLHGLAVHRAALFDVLHDAVCERNISVRCGVEVIALERNGQLRDVNNDSHGPFDLIIDASGANSRLLHYAIKPIQRRILKYGAIWSSLNWSGDSFHDNFLAQRYAGAHTMVGVLPIGRHRGVSQDQLAFFWSMPWEQYDAWCTNGLEKWKTQVRSIWPETDEFLQQITHSEQMVLARYGHHTLPLPYGIGQGNCIAFIGDAAHATSPQLGQGANMALLDAWALGQAVQRYDNPDLALSHYADLRRWHVRLFQFASLTLTPFYQSESRSLALLRDLFFDPLSRLPLARRVVAGLISGLLADPLGKLALDRQSLEKLLDTD